MSRASGQLGRLLVAAALLAVLLLAMGGRQLNRWLTHGHSTAQMQETQR